MVHLQKFACSFEQEESGSDLTHTKINCKHITASHSFQCTFKKKKKQLKNNVKMCKYIKFCFYCELFKGFYFYSSF